MSKLDETDEHDQPPPAPSAHIEIELIDTCTLLDPSALKELADLAASALATLPNAGQVRACIVDDQRMIDAHTQYSGLATTTDVLTFDLAETKHLDQKILDTDLTICFDEASRQTANREHSIIQELLLYIIHGTLHCLGYNDHSETDFQRMHHKEDEILRAIGLPDTFFTPTQQGPES